MPLPGHYVISFTDPANGTFIIEPYKTDGTVSATSPTLPATSANANTSLLFFGKGMPSYGQDTIRCLVALLENFAGPTAPVNPIEGQLWFDTSGANNILKTYGGTAWVATNAINVAPSAPISPTTGEMWFDDINNQLMVHNGTSWISVASNYLPLTGGNLTGSLDLGGFAITSVLDPVALQDAATKKYVDDEIAAVSGPSGLATKLDIEHPSFAGYTLDWDVLGTLKLTNTNLDLDSNTIINVPNPSSVSATEVVPASYLETRVDTKITSALNTEVGPFINRGNVDVTTYFTGIIGAGAIGHIDGDINARITTLTSALGLTPATYVDVAGDTMTGDLKFNIPVVVSNSSGIVFFNGTDTNSIYSRNVDGASQTTLAFEVNGAADDAFEFIHVVGGLPTTVMKMNTSGIILSNIQIKSVAAPTDPTDAATKSYVDTTISSITIPTTANISSTRSIEPVTGFAQYSTPAYVVGNNSLWVFLDGMKQIEGGLYHYNEDAFVPSTSGMQLIDFGGALVGTNSAGLTTAGSPYTVTIDVDGTPFLISVTETIDNAMTVNAVILSVQGQLGAAATISLVAGDIEIVSASTGISSTIATTSDLLFVAFGGTVGVAIPGQAPQPITSSTSITFNAPIPATGTLEFLVMSGTLS